MAVRVANQGTRRRWRLGVDGTVQGVGFRPFIYGLAHTYGLVGWVCNTGDGVDIEIEGPEEELQRFLAALTREAPPLARIAGIRRHEIAIAAEENFVIRASESRHTVRAGIPPDVATCPACAAEVSDPSNRRHGYPFTNCTHCGPRFTIIRNLPYDRPRTTMAGFPMCPACQAEYEDPLDRRFHAQPNACPVCGPHLALDGHPDLDDAEALTTVADLLRRGKIVAIKGLGGYHLACDATNEAAVAALRERKGRGGKPFAVMIENLPSAHQLCELDEHTEQLLCAVERPIVLLPVRPDNGIAPSVAPGITTLGLMLPYTPLHHLLVARAGSPLVMTSGNLSDEPIVSADEQAHTRLGHIADTFLSHNRPIHVACDDSVVRPHPAGPMLVRRARGYVPAPLLVAAGEELPPVLACGGDLKNTFCLTRGETALLSQHLGDLENAATLDHAREMIAHFCAFYDVHPAIVAHDLHPDYHSTRLARSLAAERHVAVQHHHAHIAACLAEHRVAGPVIGLAFDGTGYGPDGVIWGGEFLIADQYSYRRAGHLAAVALPGGEAAIRHPGRIALAHLLRAGMTTEDAAACVPGLSRTEADVVALQAIRGLNAPLTTSMGRLFDAAAALLGICSEVTYEGQAAIALEMCSRDADACGYSLPLIPGSSGAWVLDPGPLLIMLRDALQRGEDVGVLAGRFHAAVAHAAAELCDRLREETGLAQVALSGGVFQNVLLLDLLTAELSRRGFQVYRHQSVPCNDGGLSLGQAIVAARRAQRLCV